MQSAFGVDRREGHHIGGIAAGIRGGVREVAMLRLQSVPNGIEKKTLRQVVIRLKMHGWRDCSRLAGVRAQVFCDAAGNFIIAILAGQT
jgi:hypothetical protein